MQFSNESLVKQIQDGDREHIQDLWNQNKPLIDRVAWSFTGGTLYPAEKVKGRKGNPNADILQECYVCFLESLPEYNPDKGSYISFLINRLRWHLIRVMNNSDLVSVPEWLSSLRNRLHRYELDFYQNNGSYPSDADVCKTLQIDHKQLDYVRRVDLPLISLDTPLSDSDDEESLYTIIGGSAAEIDDCVTALYNQELMKVWKSINRILTQREFDILRKRYVGGSSYSCIGEQYNITPERVRTIIDNSLGKIRQNGICMKEIQSLDGEGAEHGYYVGGVGAYKNNLFTSSTEKRAIHNTMYRKKRKARKENIDQIEKELISFFGDVV